MKQKKFLNIYLGLGNATEAAFQVYNCKNRNVANAIGAENLAKPSIRLAVDNALRRQGLTVSDSAKALKDLLGATKIAIFNDKFRVVPDYSCRLKAVQEYHRIIGV